MEFLIDGSLSNAITIITPCDPEQRGCQLSLVLKKKEREVHKQLTKNGFICDWREPDVIRVAPVPLYNTFQDIFCFVELLEEIS